MRTTSLTGIQKKQAFRAAIDTVGDLGYSVMDKDLRMGYLVAQKQHSRFAFSKELIIELVATTARSVRLIVEVRSLGIQMMNWEANKEIEANVVQRIREGLVPQSLAS